MNDDGSFRDIGHLDLSKLDSLFMKVDYFRTFIKMCEYFKGDVKIYVEAPLMGFAANKSTIHTIILLQKFNALCCYNLYLLLNKEPTVISESTVRKACGIIIPKKTKRDDKKKIVLAHVRVLNQVPESTWAFKKTGNPKDWCFDRADSFVVARGAYKLYHEAK